MKIKRRPHPDTIPGARFLRDSSGKPTDKRSSVPMGTHKGAGRARGYTAVEWETMERTDASGKTHKQSEGVTFR